MFRPSFEVCDEHFHYSPESGILRWKKPRARKIKKWSLAGSMNREGYWRVTFYNKSLAGHRLAWLLHYGEWPGGDTEKVRIQRALIARLEARNA